MIILTIEEALYSELSSITPQVYPVSAKQKATLPYLIYQVRFTDRTKHLGGYDGLIEKQFDINIFHSSYSALKTLTAQVVNIFINMEQRVIASTGPFIQSVNIENEYDNFEPVEATDQTALYRSFIDVTFFYKEG